jgi:hypothetical protein
MNSMEAATVASIAQQIVTRQALAAHLQCA